MKLQGDIERLKAFQLNEKRRQLKQLQMIIEEFRRITSDLEQQIIIEEKKTGVSDPNHFAYSAFAKSARQRAGNLITSIQALLVQQEALVSALEEMESEYALVTSSGERGGTVRT